MSVIVAVVYPRAAFVPRWQQFHLHGRYLPARLMSSLLPQLRRWADYVRPILWQGNLVGLWVSSRMSSRRWQRLRALAEPFLVSEPGATAASQPSAVEASGPRLLALSKCGLHIPRRSVDHLQEVLAQLGDIEITGDDMLNGEALLIPAGVSLKGLFSALEVIVEPVEEASPSKRRHLLELLRQEIRKLDPSAV